MGKTLSKEHSIKGQNLFHPVRYALTGEMSGQDVTKQLSLLEMVEFWGDELQLQMPSVTLKERMIKLEAFLETIPEQYREPIIKESKPIIQKGVVAVEETVVKEQVPKYDGPPFSALDIRVGYVKHAYVHPEADKLYVEEIDVGEEEPRTICSGLRPHLELEQLIGKKVLVFCNLKARNMLGVKSHGMVLCVSDESVKLLNPPSEATIGAKVTLLGEEGEPMAENKIGKKKIWEKIQPFLKSDEHGTAMFLDSPLLTSEGVCTC